jgi:hypothetical protein
MKTYFAKQLVLFGCGCSTAERYLHPITPLHFVGATPALCSTTLPRCRACWHDVELWCACYSRHLVAPLGCCTRVLPSASTALAQALHYCRAPCTSARRLWACTAHQNTLKIAFRACNTADCAHLPSRRNRELVGKKFRDAKYPY